MSGSGNTVPEFLMFLFISLQPNILTDRFSPSFLLLTVRQFSQQELIHPVALTIKRQSKMNEYYPTKEK